MTKKINEMSSIEQRREYYGAVNASVDSIVNEIENNDPEDVRPLAEMVWSEVDNSRWIIYHGYNLHVLNHSRNEPEGWKHLVSDDDSYRDVIQTMAYKAMEQDVYEEFHDRDIEHPE